jgi:hypothetical protein
VYRRRVVVKKHTWYLQYKPPVRYLFIYVCHVTLWYMLRVGGVPVDYLVMFYNLLSPVGPFRKDTYNKRVQHTKKIHRRR